MTKASGAKRKSTSRTRKTTKTTSAETTQDTGAETPTETAAQTKSTTGDTGKKQAAASTANDTAAEDTPANAADSPAADQDDSAADAAPSTDSTAEADPKQDAADTAEDAAKSEPADSGTDAQDSASAEADETNASEKADKANAEGEAEQAAADSNAQDAAAKTNEAPTEAAKSEEQAAAEDSPEGGAENPADSPEKSDAADDEAADHDTEGSFQAQGGTIRWWSWLPAEPASGLVVLVHGVAEHSGRYAHVVRALNEAGYAVYALDHAGHGKSDGARANIGSMDAAADNVATLLRLAREKHADLPAFLLAHSMGSLIVLHLATRAELDVTGIVLSAPPLDIPTGNPIQRLAAPLLTRMLPNLGVLKLDSADISRDPDVVAAYDNDPMVSRGKIPARTAVEFLKTVDAVQQRLPKLTVPALVMHGTADAIAGPSGTDLIEKQAGTEDLTVRRYDGLYHEIFNEPEKDQVITNVVDWLKAHTKGRLLEN